MIRGLEGVFKPSPEKRELPDMPFIGRFVSRDPFVNEFYEFYHEADETDRRAKKLSGEDKRKFREKNKGLLRSVGFNKQDMPVSLATKLRGIARKMSDLRKEMNGVRENEKLTTEEKRKRIAALEQRIENHAKQGLRYRK